MRRIAVRPGPRLAPLALAVPLAVAALLLIGLAGGVVNAFGADAASPAAAPSPAAGATLHVGWTAEPDNLNPMIGFETSALEIFHLNYDFLVGFKASDLQPTPELATSWSHSADGKVWTFDLRHGVKWQDGQPFTAADVVFTFETVMKDQIGNYVGYTEYIKTVKALDPYTVQFTCSKAKTNMLGMPIFIVPQHIWGKLSGAQIAKSYPNRIPIVGTGPFQVVEWKRGQFVRMVANKSYWRGAPKVGQIVFSLYTNADTMVSDLKSGALQASWDIPQAEFGPIGSTPDLTAIGGVLNGFNHMGCNCYTGKASLGNPVLKDWRFRQALNWAIDRQKVVSIGYSGHATPATTIIRSGYYKPPLDWHWQPSAAELYTYDPAKAKAALDAAGYKDTNGDGVRDYKGKPITLRLYARTQSATDQRVGRLITGWLDAIGLKIDYQVIDEGAMTDKIFNYKGNTFAPDYDLFLWYWYSDPDPNFILSVITTGQIGSWSDTSFSDPEYDRLYAQQQTTLDPQARKQIVWKMQRIAYQKSPYITLTYPQWLEGYNDGRWTGWVKTPSGDGPIIYTEYNIDSYLFAHPVAAASTTATSGNTGLYVAIAAGAAVLVVVVLLVVRARRRRTVEE